MFHYYKANAKIHFLHLDCFKVFQQEEKKIKNKIMKTWTVERDRRTRNEEKSNTEKPAWIKKRTKRTESNEWLER